MSSQEVFERKRNQTAARDVQLTRQSFDLLIDIFVQMRSRSLQQAIVTSLRPQKV